MVDMMCMLDSGCAIESDSGGILEHWRSSSTGEEECCCFPKLRESNTALEALPLGKSQQVPEFVITAGLA